MQTRSRGLAALGAVVAAALCAGLVGVGPAQAAGAKPSAGTAMTLSPTSGNNQVIPSFTTTAGCPTGATHTSVSLFGGALPDDGQVIADVARSAGSTSAGFTREGTRRFQDAFDAAGTAITAGAYRAELVCANEAGAKLATFTTDLTFTSPTAFVAGAQAGGARSITNACPSGTTPAATFTDVPAGNVHRKSIDCLVYWRVTAGKTATTYDPTGNVTRGQMARFLANVISESGGTLPANPPSKFSDVKGTTFETSINQLAALGVVGGRADGTFAPNEPLRRDAMATFLVTGYQTRTGTTLAAGPDAFGDDNQSVHQANINKAAAAGFTGGTTATTYNPSGLVTRDQMASFLSRVLDKLVTDNGVVRKG